MTTPDPTAGTLDHALMGESEVRAALTHLGYPQASLLGQYWHENELHPVYFSAMGIVLNCPNPDLRLVRSLLALGHHPHDDATKNTSGLRLACRYGDRKIVELFLAHGADPNRPNDTGVLLLTELFSFSPRLDPFIVELLLEAGADPDMPNFRDESPRDFLHKHRTDSVGQFSEIEAVVSARKNRKNLEATLPPGQDAHARLRL
jgi:ankyrin repeat protein